MPVEVTYNTFAFDESILDSFQTHIEQFTKTAWLQSVSGGGPFGVSCRDSRYQREIQAGNVIRRENSEGVRISVFTGGQIAKQYEDGVPPFDMKEKLLNGPNAKQGKNGPYNTVPFRHGTKGAGKNRNTVHFQQMPKEIYNVVKQRPKVSASSGLIVTGKSQAYLMQPSKNKQSTILQKKTQGPFMSHTTADIGHGSNKNITTKGTRLTGTGDFHRQGKIIFPKAGVQVPGGFTPKTYQWKTGKFEGMIRMEKKYDKATQTHYMTFRRVSRKSAPSSWWHPGFPKLGIMEHLSRYVENKLPMIWQDINYHQLNHSGL